MSIRTIHSTVYTFPVWGQLVAALAGSAYTAWRVYDAAVSYRGVRDDKGVEASIQDTAQHLVVDASLLLSAQLLLVCLGVVSVILPPVNPTELTIDRIVISRWILILVTGILTLKSALARRFRLYLRAELVKEEQLKRRRLQQVPIMFPDRRKPDDV